MVKNKITKINIVYAVVLYRHLRANDFTGFNLPTIRAVFFTLPSALAHVKKLCKIEDDQYDYLLESKSILEIQEAQFEDPGQSPLISDGEISHYRIEILSVED